ncbi:MAG: prepilin-type N-terminal cleavage/methylation domain-containing protein [Candidatus Riflebacteria bacterium]|nr:prepilin-type N-terminal cleavage/methylation domain-containing protein [Candidatus Riflebacteria bacterium]
MYRKQGFTLLELLLVVAVLAILAAAVGPSFYSRGQVSIEQARKDKFISNYNSLALAANMFLIASDTTYLFRTGDAEASFWYGASSGGLTMLVASHAVSLDTCQYENTRGELRYFLMTVMPKTGTGRFEVVLSKTQSQAGFIWTVLETAPGAFQSVEAFLQTGRSVADLWEHIKND